MTNPSLIRSTSDMSGERRFRYIFTKLHATLRYPEFCFLSNFRFYSFQSVYFYWFIHAKAMFGVFGFPPTLMYEIFKM